MLDCGVVPDEFALRLGWISQVIDKQPSVYATSDQYLSILVQSHAIERLLSGYLLHCFLLIDVIEV